MPFEYYENNNIRLTKDDNGKVVDVQLLMNSEAHQAFLDKVPAKHHDWRSESLSSIMHHALATYRKKAPGIPGVDDPHHQKFCNIDQVMTTVRNCLSNVATLETLTNTGTFFKAGETPLEKIKELKEYLNKYEIHTQTLLHESKNPSLMESWESLKARIDDFREQLETLEAKTPTMEELQQLFSPQDEGSIQSLGDFLSDQLMVLAEAGIQAIYAIEDDRIGQLFSLNPAIKALSDAKAGVEARARSLYGARYPNRYRPIPDVMRKIPIIPVENDEQIKWQSIRPYVESFRHAKEVDQVLSVYLDSPDQNVEGSNPSVLLKIWNGIKAISSGFVMITAGATELGFSLLRIAPTTLSFFMSLSPPLRPFAEKLEHTIAAMHHEGSLIRLARHLLGREYQATTTDRATLLEAISPSEERSQSAYNRLITHYLSGSRLAKSFTDTIWQTGWSLFSPIFVGLPYIVSTGRQSKSPQKAFNAMAANVKAVEAEHIRILKEALEPKATRIETDSEDQEFFVSDQEEEKAEPTSEPQRKAQQETYGAWASIAPWESNEYTSVLDFFDEIIVGLSDVVIDPMFRKVPGLSTFFFMISQASLGAMMVPSAAAALGATGHVLTAIPGGLSTSFTGQPISEGMMNKAIAAFLEWKLGFFGSEFLVEASHGNFDFLEILLEQPEAITLGLFVLISAGIGLQFLPTLPTTITINGIQVPNYYAEAVNIFSEEAGHCAHGMVPFTSIEYAFLGLKFALLTETLFSGQHNSGIKPIHMKKLVDRFFNQKVLELENPEERKQCIAQALIEQGIADEETINSPQHVNLINQIEKTIKELQNPEERISALLDERGSETEIEETAPTAPTLEDALLLVQKMDALGQKFPSQKQADLFYDYLDRLFDEHNQGLRKQGLFHEIIDKRDYLHNFYNRHCYRGSTVLLRILSIFPLYPATLVWRGLKYAAAKSNWFYSPSIAHQVEKSFNKDKAMLLQSVAMISRNTRVAARSYLTYAGRFFTVALPLLPAIVGLVIVSPLLLLKSFREPILNYFFRFANFLSKKSTKLAAHRAKIPFFSKIRFEIPFLSKRFRFTVPDYLKRSYARNTRKAGTNSQDLGLLGQSILQRLNQQKMDQATRIPNDEEPDLRDAAPIQENHSTPTPEEKVTKTNTALADYYKKQAQSYWPTASARMTQLERIARAVNDSTLSDSKKEEALDVIAKEMRGSSRLKETITNPYSGLFSATPRRQDLDDAIQPNTTQTFQSCSSGK